MIQCVGLIVELPLGDSQPIARKDVDLEGSRTDTTRHIPRAMVTTCGKAIVCGH